MTSVQSNNEVCSSKGNDLNRDKINKSNESLVRKDKNDVLPHQDHGYAWVIVLGKLGIAFTENNWRNSEVPFAGQIGRRIDMHDVAQYNCVFSI